MRKIIRNAIKCNHCGDIIESKHTYDYKRCRCRTVAVDGGLDYLRRAYISEGDYTDLSEFEEEKPFDASEFMEKMNEFRARFIEEIGKMDLKHSDTKCDLSFMERYIEAYRYWRILMRVPGEHIDKVVYKELLLETFYEMEKIT